MMKRETELRNWVKKVWKGVPLTWVEPRAGSSVGAADVYVPMNGLLLPVELKLFCETAQGFKVVGAVRPAQIAYHAGLGKVGVRSIFLFGSADPKNKTVWFVPSWIVVGCCLNDKLLLHSQVSVLCQDNKTNDLWFGAVLSQNAGVQNNGLLLDRMRG